MPPEQKMSATERMKIEMECLARLQWDVERAMERYQLQLQRVAHLTSKESRND